MFTSGFVAFITPAMAAQPSASRFNFGHDAIIKDVDRLDRLICQLACKSAQMTCQFHPRPHDPRFLCGDRRHVERVLHSTRQQVI